MFSLKTILGLLVFIIGLHVFATIYLWYWTYSWLDMPMHFLGGFWVAMVYFWLRQKAPITRGSNMNVADQHADPRVFRDLSNKISVSSAIITIVSCLSFVALIGVLWEFSEFLYDVFISVNGYSRFAQQGITDTMSDLFFDLLGGSVFLVIYRFHLLKRTHLE